jgi:hypothetical protein
MHLKDKPAYLIGCLTLPVLVIHAFSDGFTNITTGQSTKPRTHYSAAAASELGA